MEFSFFIIVLVIASFVSGFLTLFLKRGPSAIAFSILAPLGALIVYALATRDEFGTWAVILALSACCSIMGSIFGVIVARQVARKKATVNQ